MHCLSPWHLLEPVQHLQQLLHLVLIMFFLLSLNSRCLANLCPLLDSGTMGTKGHTEIIVPQLTESYNSHVSAWTLKATSFGLLTQTLPSVTLGTTKGSTSVVVKPVPFLSCFVDIMAELQRLILRATRNLVIPMWFFSVCLLLPEGFSYAIITNCFPKSLQFPEGLALW